PSVWITFRAAYWSTFRAAPPGPASVTASGGSGGAKRGCMGPWDSSMRTGSHIDQTRGSRPSERSHNPRREPVQERVVREIRMLRAMRRELETGLRWLLHGHEEGNLGYSQGAAYGLPRQFPTLPAFVKRRRRLRRGCHGCLDERRSSYDDGFEQLDVPDREEEAVARARHVRHPWQLLLHVLGRQLLENAAAEHPPAARHGDSFPGHPARGRFHDLPQRGAYGC